MPSLAGVPRSTLARLQRVQNRAAKLIMSARTRDHVTPILKQLHWLPVECRIQYKILLLTYKALHSRAPPYIEELLLNYAPSRALRSSAKHLLTVHRPRTSTYGSRCFKFAAPVLWNALPLPIRNASSLASFKRSLKTHLFKNYFDC